MKMNSEARSTSISSIKWRYAEVLLRDLRDWNVVDVELLPADQVQQQVERPFVDGGSEILSCSINLHRLSDSRHRFPSYSLGLLRPFVQDISDVVRVRFQFLSSFIEGVLTSLEAIEEPHFAFDAAYSGGATTVVHLGNSIFVGKNIVVIADRANIRVAGIGSANASGVGHHVRTTVFMTSGFSVKRDRVPVALAHLAPVRSRQLRNLRQQRLGLRKYLAV